MTVRKGFSLFMLIAVSVSLIALYFSSDASTLEILAHADKYRLLLAAALVCLTWCMDAVKLKLIILAAEEKISFKLSMLLVWLNYFGCAITPLQSGGGPFQIYMLYQNGVSVGKGIAITLVRTLLSLFVMGMAFPITMMLYPDMLQGHKYLKIFVTYIVIFLIIIWGLVTISLVRPQWIKRVAGRITILLKRFGIIKPKLVMRVIRRVSKEIDNYSENIRIFYSRGKLYLLSAVVVTALHILVQLSVLPCLIWALHLPVDFEKAILLQALFLFFLYFVPTPGGSGVAEGGATALFRILVPWNLAGVMAVSWRLFTEYSGIFLGTIVALRCIGWTLAEQLVAKNKANEAIEE